MHSMSPLVPNRSLSRLKCMKLVSVEGRLGDALSLFVKLETSVTMDTDTQHFPTSRRCVKLMQGSCKLKWLCFHFYFWQISKGREMCCGVSTEWQRTLMFKSAVREFYKFLLKVVADGSWWRSFSRFIWVTHCHKCRSNETWCLLLHPALHPVQTLSNITNGRSVVFTIHLLIAVFLVSFL